MVRNIQGDTRTSILAVPQHLSEAALAALEHQVTQASLSKPEILAVDLSNVHSVDSASLNWLLALQTRMVSQGIHLELRTPSTIMASALLATRLDHRFKIINDDPIPEQRHA